MAFQCLTPLEAFDKRSCGAGLYEEGKSQISDSAFLFGNIFYCTFMMHHSGADALKVADHTFMMQFRYYVRKRGRSQFDFLK